MLDPISPDVLEEEATAMNGGGWRNVPTLLRRAALTIRDLHERNAALETRRHQLATEVHAVRAEYREAKAAAFTARIVEADAALGALLRQIWTHPESCVLLKTTDGYTCTLTAQGLQAMLAHLDGLRPKESEWSDLAPSGCRYRFHEGRWYVRKQSGDGFWLGNVPLIDVQFVAKLIGGKNG